MKIGDVNNNIHDNDYRFLGRIFAIYMKSFNSKSKWPKLKHEFVLDEEIVICTICEAMSLITDCHSPLLIKFTGKITKEKVSLVAKEETIIKCLAIPINKKLELANSMLNSKMYIVYKSLDKNVVMNMTRNDVWKMYE